MLRRTIAGQCRSRARVAPSPLPGTPKRRSPGAGKLDPARRRLWFATWAPGVDTATSPARRATNTRLFTYDLATGGLTRYTLADSLRDHLLNDLVLAPCRHLRVQRLARLAVRGLSVGGAPSSAPWPITSMRPVSRDPSRRSVARCC
jgi:hypothetical protein